MSRLRLRPTAARGLVHDVTPASAGWGYAGFALWRLAPGDRAAAPPLSGTETILVLVEGRARIAAAGQDWGELGDRLDPFERKPPHALYLPPGAAWQAEATAACVLAVCRAPSPGGRPALRLGPEGIALQERGQGTNRRYVHNIAMEGRDVADSLLVTEVFTPAGHWSSYPSHRHDEDDFPRITYLEETYYMRLSPAQGFAVQRIYTEDGALDETLTVKDHDVTLVPRGHHPCGAAHGYDLYYLNVMAGPRRAWRFANDPDHDWIARRDG
jgi:5-deoxy-glucuronate isomerase